MRSLASPVLLLAGLSSALHLPIQRIKPRSSSSSTYMSRTSGGEGLGNTNNILYTAEVKVGSKSYTLQLDTGSSDLWFAPDKDYNQTFASATIYEDLQVNLTYGTGWSAGAIAQTDVEFAGFRIKNQSFLFIEELSEWDIDFEQQYPAYQGIAGLSFDTLSEVNSKVLKAYNSTWGRSLMSNIFLSDPSTPNHIAFFLDRTGDLNDTDVGYFDIGTYATGYEAVANTPKHEVFTGYKRGVLQWNALLNEISINGKPQALKSSVVTSQSSGITNSPPKGSISALLDTGTSAAEIPEEAFHTLYKAMGGVLITDSTTYAVPCMAEAEVVLTFGNQTAAVHPLDLTQAKSYDVGIGQNLTICTSSYGPASYEGGDNDIILGDSFLRNVYAVYNYGDFVATESGMSTTSPFIQILPITDPRSASAEFKTARAKALAALPAQIDVTTINDPTPKPLNGTGSSSSSGGNTTAKLSPGSSNAALSVSSNSGSSDDDTAAYLKKLTTLVPIALGLLGLSVAFLIIVAVMLSLVLVRLKKQMPGSGAAAYVPLPLQRESVGEYKDKPTKYDPQFRD